MQQVTGGQFVNPHADPQAHMPSAWRTRDRCLAFSSGPVLLVMLQNQKCHAHGQLWLAHVFLMPLVRPNLAASPWIWQASSRVGASTSKEGPWRGSGLSLRIRTMPGSRNPQVLPLPVLAMDTRSRPCMAMGQDCAWMGVGSLYPARSICRHYRVTLKEVLPKGIAWQDQAAGRAT